MTSRGPWHIPDPNIIDLVTGYSISLPLGDQDYPGWQEDRPEVIARLLRLREEHGIAPVDDNFKPRPAFVPITSVKGRPPRPISRSKRHRAQDG